MAFVDITARTHYINWISEVYILSAPKKWNRFVVLHLFFSFLGNDFDVTLRIFFHESFKHS